MLAKSGTRLTYDRPDRWLLKVAIRRLRRMERKGRLVKQPHFAS